MGNSCDQAYHQAMLPALCPIDFKRIKNSDIRAAQQVFTRMQRMRDENRRTVKPFDDPYVSTVPFIQQKYLFRDLCEHSSEHLVQIPEFRELISEWLFTVLRGFSKTGQRDGIVLDTLDLMMHGIFGMSNHAYILLAFERFFVEYATDESNQRLESFTNTFCERQVCPTERIQRDNQAKIFFHMLYRLFGQEKVAELISEPSKGETMVHKAARAGLYTLVADEMIGELGFNIDFWEPRARLTVVN